MKYEKKKMNNKTTSEHFDKNIKILIPVASYDPNQTSTRNNHLISFSSL